MNINDGKAREILNRVHEFLSNLCRDARCDDHCSECLGASDLADDVYELLHTPQRNCDRFTNAEEAWDAYDEWADSYRAQGKTEPFNEVGWLFAPATEKKGGDDENE